MPPFLLDPRHRARLFSAIWGLAGALVLVAGWWLWHFPTDRWELQSHVMELTDAEALASQRATPPDDWDNWVRVSLPHRWSQTHRQLTGSLWYRLNAPMSKVPLETWAVYLPKVSMNAEVWVNGVSLGVSGSMERPLSANWYTPLLFTVPPSLWRAGDNVVEVRVAGDSISRSGLAPVWVGSARTLSQMHTQRWWVQVMGVHAANVGLMMLGLFLVVLWMRDRTQSAFGYIGQAAILWGVGSSGNIVPDPFLPMKVWDAINFTAIVWAQLSLCLFFLRFSERHWLWAERLIAGFAVLDPLVVALMPSQMLVGLTYLFIYLVALVGFALALWHAYRTRRPDRNLFAFGSLVSIPAAAHDVALQLNQLSFESVYMLPYAGPVLVGCMAFIVAGDHARSRQALAHLNDDLMDSIHRREAELRDSFQRVSSLEQAQAVSAERARILRDMHDGVGAHLTTALRQLNPTTPQPVDLRMVTRILREALDQLKLSIDAMSMPPGDVVGLLASLRFRMTPRFKAAGLSLRWDVGDLPEWPAGTQAALRQLQYILFEAMSNVLQHAGAQEVTLQARLEGEQLLVVLHDDGRGLSGPGVKPEGHGSQTMRSRAGTLGAGIEFVSPPQGGYEVRLTLPMGRPDERQQ
ncbi:ATP-binding protein [Aquabacterium sp.]|uniref:sensor histidine kinase n=1 Tax=Aquabacterium sp. TaxID=1872578 RepID=UPI003D6D99DB